MENAESMMLPLSLKDISVPAPQTFHKLPNSVLILIMFLAFGILLEVDSAFGVLSEFYRYPFTSDLKQCIIFCKEGIRLINYS